MTDPAAGVLEAPAEGRYGICCSGGGIRSAAFNLGALQVLQAPENRILQRATYLAAVSGGSYMAAGLRDGRQGRRRRVDSDRDLVTDDGAAVPPRLARGAVPAQPQLVHGARPRRQGAARRARDPRRARQPAVPRLAAVRARLGARVAGLRRAAVPRPAGAGRQRRDHGRGDGGRRARRRLAAICGVDLDRLALRPRRAPSRPASGGAVRSPASRRSSRCCSSACRRCSSGCGRCPTAARRRPPPRTSAAGARPPPSAARARARCCSASSCSCARA